VFLDPYQSPLRSGYNIIQSQIAVGSGGWFGQGYLQGSQSQLGFIPELWTDFIFSVAVEELGLLFGIYLITLFFLLVYSVFSAAALSKDPKGYTVCAGIGVLWMAHTAVNLGVCLGLIPVIGLPLPFTSYGGSFMLTNWLMIGLLVGLSGGTPTGRGY
jgi:rod shape determining protein RodA